MNYFELPKGKSYEDYTNQWNDRLSASMKGLDLAARKRLMHRKYNWERAEHVMNNFEHKAESHAAMAKLPKQFWVVITEDWCLDSAFHLAVMKKMSEYNSEIELKIIERDSHPEVMDNYLTNGGKAIPILVVYDESGKELFHFGPRPKAAKAFRENLVDQGLDKNEISKQLLDFYMDKGWQHTEEELLELLKNHQLEAI